ncbi:MAG: DNA replication and repair protein RecF, partial [Pseudonocardiales bacterium]|nr:DNA replication and repair protein RecF [Pseudonocardiales bacterium]
MYLSQLAVTDFRSWSSVELNLKPGASVLVGPNGVGKTNLVEAAGYLATFSSHRAATDAPLVRRGAAAAIVRGVAVRDGRELTVEVQITPGKANRARVNRAPVPRARDAMGIVRSVVFAPEDLALVRGDPGERRRFLDELLVSRWPRYAGVRADYERVVRQRSALLKT